MINLEEEKEPIPCTIKPEQKSPLIRAVVVFFLVYGNESLDNPPGVNYKAYQLRVDRPSKFLPSVKVYKQLILCVPRTGNQKAGNFYY